MVDYVNAHTEEYGINLLYSTPRLYVETINKMKVNYGEETYDFFPYADEIDAYWTGYFTSRIAIKYNIKLNGRYL